MRVKTHHFRVWLSRIKNKSPETSSALIYFFYLPYSSVIFTLYRFLFAVISAILAHT